MNKICVLCFVVCFVLLAYLFSLNTGAINKLNELEGKIKRLEKTGTALILPSKVDQVYKEKQEQVEHHQQDQVEQIALDSTPQIKQMIEEAVQQHLQKEAESKRAQGIYNSVNFMAKMLKLSDEQKDEFWPIMIEYYEEYQRIKDGFKGLDKTSRDSYSWQIKQLSQRTMRSLKQILSSQQMEGLQIHLPE